MHSKFLPSWMERKMEIQIYTKIYTNIYIFWNAANAGTHWGLQRDEDRQWNVPLYNA